MRNISARGLKTGSTVSIHLFIFVKFNTPVIPVYENKENNIKSSQCFLFHFFYLVEMIREKLCGQDWDI